MHDTTLALLRGRFRHFDLERARPLLHPDQPEDGQKLVRGQGKFPGVQMATGVWWFPDRERRPVNKQGAPMKSQAPPGPKPLTVDDSTRQAVVVVEGEGHGVAVRCVGWDGVVIAGGVATLRSNSPEAREQRRQRFAGRDVWLWFDFDGPGQEAAPAAAQQIMDAGATRVAIIERPGDWEDGQDLEDWLASFDSPELARGALVQELGKAQWLTRNSLAEKQGEAAASHDEIAIELLVPVGEGQPDAFLVTVYDEEADEIKLAVMGPTVSGAATEQRWSVQHDATPGERAWQVTDSWVWGGQTYRPDDSAPMLAMARDNMIVLPAPPIPYGTSEALWADVRAYFKGFLATARSEDYDVLTSYVLLTYRIFDEETFEHCPYLRIHGPPGSGKTQALKLLRRLCWRTFSGQATQSNIHRFMDHYRSVTLICDEFHLEGKAAERRAEMIDLLNLGSERSAALIRCDTDRATGRIIPKMYRLFGPKVFAGYGSDEHEALARRTVAIDMTGVHVPPAMEQLVASADLGKAAYTLRRRLLDWRLAKAQLGRADAEGALARQLLDRAGRDIAQNIWPLLAMVPAGLPEAVEAIMRVAEGRKSATQQTRHISPDAVVLDAVTKAARKHWYREQTFIPTSEIQAVLEGDPAFRSTADVSQALVRLGFTSIRTRPEPGAHPVRGWLIDRSQAVTEVFSRYGITWPPEEVTSGTEPAL